MLNELLEIYDDMDKKDDDIAKIADILGFSDASSYLGKSLQKLETVIVKALGGTEEHYEFIVDNGDYFYQYRHQKLSKEELIATIQGVIENH